MVNITKADKFMGAALAVSFDDEGAVRVDGHRIRSYSVNDLRAYADVGLPSPAVGWWELTAEQAGELLEKAPGLRLHAEVAAEAAKGEGSGS